MSVIWCSEKGCQSEAEYSCNCTSPETHLCKIHLGDHCISSNEPHSFSSLFLQIKESTKESILAFLVGEKSKINEMKSKILVSFDKTFKNYENAFNSLLEEIDSKSVKINIYFEKILNACRVSSFENDEVLKLLLLQQTSEISQNIKAIFTNNLNNKIKDFDKMSDDISKIINNFNEGKNTQVKVDSNKIEIKMDSYVEISSQENKNDKTLNRTEEIKNYRSIKQSQKIINHPLRKKSGILDIEKFTFKCSTPNCTFQCLVPNNFAEVECLSCAQKWCPKCQNPTHPEITCELYKERMNMNSGMKDLIANANFTTYLGVKLLLREPEGANISLVGLLNAKDWDIFVLIAK